MTKEDLKSKFEDSFDAHSRASEGGMGPDVTDWRGMWRSFEPAILEYAKRQSIAFADFAIKEGFYPDNNEFGRWKNIKSKYKATWSTQDIHNQLIEQQNKSNG